MAYFTVFQDRLVPTAELPRGEREKIDEFLRLLDDSGVGGIVQKETLIILTDYSLLSYMLSRNIQEV